ncbi:hypothetical protein K490DRAFT_64982 [Saccharata proteae CBS 121410]|uniref:SMP domain-containing protein n=1 Tax=Saccharata proteae CBS 121410 TaxID=1314787 RepID=A0A9P4LY12_9PEZI|nr:hypothetical protein K490DRAFT_64982 [Saccharata proteae CBS 121410]
MSSDPTPPKSVEASEQPQVADEVKPEQPQVIEVAKPEEPQPGTASDDRQVRFDSIEPQHKVEGEAASATAEKTSDAAPGEPQSLTDAKDRLAATMQRIEALTKTFESDVDTVPSTENKDPSTITVPSAIAGQKRGRRPSAAEQSHVDLEHNFEVVANMVKNKMEHDPKSVTGDDAKLLVSREQRAHGHVEKGGITSQAQSLADKNASVADTAEAPAASKDTA